MTSGLSRYQQCGDLHFITFSSYQRRPYLRDPLACALFENALEDVRRRYRLAILGYVTMPEHVHLLVNEPGFRQLERAIQAIKISVSRRRPERPFWLARYYDFNVYSQKKTTEKLRYLHRNPVTRGLVAKPEEWPWSSFRHYATGVEGTVKIESFWTAWKWEHGAIPQTTKPHPDPRK
jgi:REP-associated tyrosine transposase